MPTSPDADLSVMPAGSQARHRPSAVAAAAATDFSLQQAARIAGAAYVVQYVTAVYPEFVVRPALIVGDAARTASNIVANEGLFRAITVCDLIAGLAVVVVNAALFQLLAPVHRGLARLAAFWRLVEVAVGTAIAVSGFAVLSLLKGAAPLQAFEARQLQDLARLLLGARQSGYMVLLLFFSFGSTTYMYLLLRSRYVPRWMALTGLVGSALGGVVALTQMLFPALVTAAAASARTLPMAALVMLGLLLAPIVLLELVLGIWLLVKGVRTGAPAAA